MLILSIPNVSDLQHAMRQDMHCLHSHKHGILREFASIVCGRFVSDCGRICGIYQTEGVEATLLKVIPKKCIMSSLIYPSLHKSMHL